MGGEEGGRSTTATCEVCATDIWTAPALPLLPDSLSSSRFLSNAGSLPHSLAVVLLSLVFLSSRRLLPVCFRCSGVLAVLSVCSERRLALYADGLRFSGLPRRHNLQHYSV